MKSCIVAAAIAVIAPVGAHAQAVPVVQTTEAQVSAVEDWLADPTRIFEAHEVDIDAFRWIARPVVVFADTPADPAFTRQIDLLRDRIGDLAARDVVVITDTRPEELSSLRERLRPRGFMLAILGKDGGVKLRKPFPWDVREIGRSIDKMPMRQQEIRERRDQGT